MDLRVSRILWAAIFASTFLLLGVLALSDLAGPGTPSTLPLPMLVAVGAAALMDAALSALLPRSIFARGLRSLALETRERPPSERLFADRPQRTRVFGDPAQARARAAVLFRTSHVLGMGLAESVCLLGFVLKFLGGSWWVSLPFFVVTWLLFATKFPRPTEIEAALERLYEADLG
jgi:hypothetical protein